MHIFILLQFFLFIYAFGLAKTIWVRNEDKINELLDQELMLVGYLSRCCKDLGKSLNVLSALTVSLNSLSSLVTDLVNKLSLSLNIDDFMSTNLNNIGFNFNLPVKAVVRRLNVLVVSILTVLHVTQLLKAVDTS
jgi:hypothetical protein